MVDYYVCHEPWSELVRHVLWYLHPQSAMDRCYEIYNTSKVADERLTAVEPLRAVSDQRGADWVREFLDDPDTSIQNMGASMLNQLLFRGHVDPGEGNICDLFDYCSSHPNE